MDFSNRGNRPSQHAGTSAPAQVSSTAAPAARPGKRVRESKSFRIAAVALLFSCTALVVALTFSIFFGGPKAEKQYIDDSKYQAVFLNGGQVYFGKVLSLNNQFLRMRDIYYLQVNQQVQPSEGNQQDTGSNDVSLVKLGCELHGPQDEMVINREQVIFWENLKTDGQVAKAVDEYQKANPNGQQCTTANSTTNTQQSTDTTQNSTNTDDN